MNNAKKNNDHQQQQRHTNGPTHDLLWIFLADTFAHLNSIEKNSEYQPDQAVDIHLTIYKLHCDSQPVNKNIAQKCFVRVAVFSHFFLYWLWKFSFNSTTHTYMNVYYMKMKWANEKNHMKIIVNLRSFVVQTWIHARTHMHIHMKGDKENLMTWKIVWEILRWDLIAVWTNRLEQSPKSTNFFSSIKWVFVCMQLEIG